MKKYQVRSCSDGVGYYVVEVDPMLGDMYVKGTSLSTQEMVKLAKKLNEQDSTL